MGDRSNDLPNPPAPEVPPVERTVENPEPNPPPALAPVELAPALGAADEVMFLTFFFCCSA